MIRTELDYDGTYYNISLSKMKFEDAKKVYIVTNDNETKIRISKKFEHDYGYYILTDLTSGKEKKIKNNNVGKIMLINGAIIKFRISGDNILHISTHSKNTKMYQ